MVILGAAFIAAGFAIGCIETAENATVAMMAPERARGSAFGLLAGLQSFGNLTASVVAGLLWSWFSPGVAFGYAAVCMAVAMVAPLALADLRAPGCRGDRWGLAHSATSTTGGQWMRHRLRRHVGRR